MSDAWNGKHPRSYAQDVFQHTKAAELTSIYNQLSMAWSNLAVKFRQHVPEPTPTTSIQQFLEVLDSKADIWYEIARHERRTQSAMPDQSGKNKQGRSEQGRSYSAY